MAAGRGTLLGVAAFSWAPMQGAWTEAHEARGQATSEGKEHLRQEISKGIESLGMQADKPNYTEVRLLDRTRKEREGQQQLHQRERTSGRRGSQSTMQASSACGAS